MRQPEVRNNNQQTNERRLLLPVFIHRPAICEFVPIRAGQVFFFIPLQDTNILCAGLCCPAADNAFQIKKVFFLFVRLFVFLLIYNPVMTTPC